LTIAAGKWSRGGTDVSTALNWDIFAPAPPASGKFRKARDLKNASMYRDSWPLKIPQVQIEEKFKKV
jgi:hypothetical protein